LLSNPYPFVVATVFLLPGALFAILAHELGHGLAADRMGDRTPRNRGYLSLANPRRFFTPYGLVMMAFWHVGWGERVPVNEYRQTGVGQKLLYDLAGPAANLLLAVVFGLAAVRRSALLEHGGFDESIVWTEDWDLWLRLILAGSGAGCVDEPLAEYRLRETSLTARRRELLLGKIGTLEKARANMSLRAEERVVLEKSIASYRRELAFQDLTVAVATGDDGTRRRATALLLAPGFDRHRRVELVGMTLAPKIAGRVLRRRARDTWVGAGGIRVRRR